MKIDKRSEESVYITINGWVYCIDDSTGEQIMDKWREGSSFDEETRQAREEMESGKEKSEYPFGVWQKSVTLKAIRENKVQGFDCHYIEKPEDMVGTMTPFKPSWNIQYLGDGTQEFFDTIKEAQEWLCSWAEGETSPS